MNLILIVKWCIQARKRLKNIKYNVPVNLVNLFSFLPTFFVSPTTFPCNHHRSLRTISDHSLCQTVGDFWHRGWKRMIHLYAACTCWPKYYLEEVRSYTFETDTMCSNARDVTAKRSGSFNDAHHYLTKESCAISAHVSARFLPSFFERWVELPPLESRWYSSKRLGLYSVIRYSTN